MKKCLRGAQICISCSEKLTGVKIHVHCTIVNTEKIFFSLVELLDTSDKVQLEVKYRLPPIPLSSRTRTKVTQVSYKISKFRDQSCQLQGRFIGQTKQPSLVNSCRLSHHFEIFQKLRTKKHFSRNS
jgi:hypothetical protein